MYTFSKNAIQLGIRILQLLHQLGVGEQVAIEAGKNAGIGVRTVDAMCFARAYLPDSATSTPLVDVGSAGGRIGRCTVIFDSS